MAGFKHPPTTQELIDCGHPKPHWGIDMISLTPEEIAHFSNFREYQNICEQHATALFQAVSELQDSISELEGNWPDLLHEIRLRDLDTKPMHEAMSAIRVDLFNKGLIDKP